jgi:virulence factor
MLSQEKLDAVMVLSTESANARIAMEVLSAGIPVFLEKPPALSREEFDRLRQVETRARAPLFVSFNRRHTPLLQGMELSGPPLRIEGRMERLKREVSDFPYTALHLVDSLLYFSHARPTASEVVFTAHPVPAWRLDCQLGGTCTASLEVVPDGSIHCEYLLFTGPDWSVEIQFPNPESHFCEGRVIRISGGRRQVITGQKDISAHEHMGYAPSLRGFLQHVSAGQVPPPSYRLSTSRSAIALMEDMMDAYRARASVAQSQAVTPPLLNVPHESH